VAPPPQDDGGGSPSIAGNFYLINTGRNISIAAHLPLSVLKMALCFLVLFPTKKSVTPRHPPVRVFPFLPFGY